MSPVPRAALVAALVAAQVPGHVRALILEDPPGSTLGQAIGDSPYLLQFSGTRALLNQPRTESELTAALAELPVHRPLDGAVVKFGELRDLHTLRFAAACLRQIDPLVLDPLIAGRAIGDDRVGFRRKFDVRREPSATGSYDTRLLELIDEIHETTQNPCSVTRPCQIK